MKTHIRQQCSNLVSAHWEKNETEKKELQFQPEKKNGNFNQKKRMAISTRKKELQFQPEKKNGNFNRIQKYKKVYR